MNFYVEKCIIKMKSDSKLKEIDIKNRACNYFNGIVKIQGFDLDDILIDKKNIQKHFSL